MTHVQALAWGVKACLLFCALLLAGCAQKPSTPTRVVDFPLSAYQLIDQDGRDVHLAGTFPADQPVVITFMFTTCKTDCPQLAASFATLQSRLGSETGRVRLLAISLDPVQDSPKAMKAFLAQFRAKEGWDLYTGSDAELRRLRHELMDRVPGEGPLMPITFLRSPRDQRWIRIAGQRSSSEFMEICVKEGVL